MTSIIHQPAEPRLEQQRARLGSQVQERAVWAEVNVGSKEVQAAGSPQTSVSLKHHHPAPSGSAELLCRNQKYAFFMAGTS